MAKLDASPNFMVGGSFGHAFSTSNSGRLRDRDCASTTMRRFPKRAAAMMTKEIRKARATCIPRYADEPHGSLREGGLYASWAYGTAFLRHGTVSTERRPFLRNGDLERLRYTGEGAAPEAAGQ